MLTNAASIIVLSLLAAWSIPSVADPPPYAPAYGWRKHHDHRRDKGERRRDGDEHRRDEREDRRDEDNDRYYVDDSDRPAELDYGIRSGRCNREAMATALGGVVGGVVGSRVAKPGNRTIATILGAAAGALIGKKIGHELDEADRGCFGHALEIGKTGQRVVWTDTSTSVRYEMVPGTYRERNGTPCRNFTLWAVAGGHKSTQVGIACRSQPGLWQVVD